jgi:hypothetical protein
MKTLLASQRVKEKRAKNNKTPLFLIAFNSSFSWFEILVFSPFLGLSSLRIGSFKYPLWNNVMVYIEGAF